MVFWHLAEANWLKNKCNYVAQAFLLAASIFGLDYYVKLITRKINEKHSSQ